MKNEDARNWGNLRDGKSKDGRKKILYTYAYGIFAIQSPSKLRDIDNLSTPCKKNEGPWAVDGALLVLEKWRPNLVLGNLQVNYISIWVQLQGLPLEYQHPELTEKMGEMMGIVDRVDWEDRIPRNIRFMRIKMCIDPWLPVIARFVLRLDDGTRT
ncbi:hypothetical protein CMV_005251 [Castanea mollissima]|uniref:DUF4283 domain-containing protein n=1 Tax=Castanea mollissima TaxID=60419 RepID=A0A8J4RXE6_9ROSI|nr:hypothetical protein CMV_005251 [Castanea mollissima]